MSRRATAVTFVLSCVASVLVVAPAQPATAAEVPSGFADRPVAEFARPTTVEWLPNGRIAVLEQAGRLQVGTPDGTFTTRLSLDVCSSSERGLLGMATDPAFLSTGWVYLYYTRRAPGSPGGCLNRLSRFTLPGDGPIDPASEVVLLDNISSVNGNHNGGAVEIGGDGYLYVGVGDAGRDPRGDSGSAGNNDAAQDLSLLNGKILRITRDGQPAPGNPLLGQPGVTSCATRGNTADTPDTPCAEIFAWGLRNPYRLAFDRDEPGGTRFFINDVGQGTYEEIDSGQPGNFGWPDREGPCPAGDTLPCDGPPDGVIDPISAYGRTLGTFITGGAFVPAGVWGATHDRAYLFGDGGTGRIWNLPHGGTVDYAAPFATEAEGLTDMVFGYDAAGRATLYYTQVGGALRAITPTDEPRHPSAEPTVFTATEPYRTFDTGVERGERPRHVAGTTRLVDAQLPEGATAALVNLTIADTAGAGYLRTWTPRGLRPATSTVNADTPGSAVANAAIVPVDSDGRFLVESSTAARVIVDVMGYFTPAPAATAAGRFVPLPSVRLADTREPVSTSNRFAESAQGWSIETELGGFPAGEVGAYVLSIGAIIDPAAPAGWVGAYAGGGTYSGTSNVNVFAGETRANLVIVPADGSGGVNLRRLNVADVVVDVLGYFTGDAAPAAASGRFAFVLPERTVDSRLATPFDRLDPLVTSSVQFAPAQPATAIVQNVTVTGTGDAGWLSTHPGTAYVHGVSSVNYTGPNQTRAVLAFTQLGPDNRIGYTSRAETDLVVDAVGLFTS